MQRLNRASDASIKKQLELVGPVDRWGDSFQEEKRRPETAKSKLNELSNNLQHFAQMGKRMKDQRPLNSEPDETMLGHNKRLSENGRIPVTLRRTMKQEVVVERRPQSTQPAENSRNRTDSIIHATKIKLTSIGCTLQTNHSQAYS